VMSCVFIYLHIFIIIIIIFYLKFLRGALNKAFVYDGTPDLLHVCPILIVCTTAHTRTHTITCLAPLT